MARYPDPASPYSVEPRRFAYRVRHVHFGILADALTSLAAAEGFIADREDEDAAVEDERAVEAAPLREAA